jgi:HK97 family phage portal protein
MGFFGPSKRELQTRIDALESRSLENPSVSLGDAKAWAEVFGSWHSSAGVEVNVDKAMGVTTFWAGVNFLSATVASVPLYLFNVTEKGQEKAEGNPLYGILNEAPNEETSSFKWRQLSMVSALHHGRSYSFIELNKAGRVMNLWPLEYSKMTVERKDGKLRYVYKDDGRTVTYAASEVIDLIWSPKADGISHFEPVNTLKNAFGLAIAMEDYASKFFQNGGVPPLQLIGPMNSPGAISRAKVDIGEALKEAKRDHTPILPMPLMHELKQIGFDPEKGQLTEARRFQLEEIARVLSLPPVFLQDLTHGTFSNTEQQDLHLVKHTIRQWFRRWEDELNLKLISRRNRRTRIRFDEDELLRGDFKTRMEGYAAGVTSALVKPDEAREAMGWTRIGGAADGLFMQGAMMPINKLGEEPVQPQGQDDDAA